MKKRKRDTNVTKYGEFVCSYYQWLPLDEQKENAERLASITKTENKK